MQEIEAILRHWGLKEPFEINTLGEGLIHKTYKIRTGETAYVLQNLNTHVFRNIDLINNNINLISKFLEKNSPSYVFPSLIPLVSGELIWYSENGSCWRLSKFLEGTKSISLAENLNQIEEAAGAFALLTKNLKDFDTDLLSYTISDFHNLSYRFQNYQNALEKSSPENLEIAENCIEKLKPYSYLTSIYEEICLDPSYPIRCIHHDTKINNTLFDENLSKALAVCDLDTLMPGRIISDLGDLVRTAACSLDENSTSWSDIHIIEDRLLAVYRGYLSIFNELLSPSEKRYLAFAGPYLTYMQALRFLTDFLENNKYYGASYPLQNLDRAFNQAILLESFFGLEAKLNRFLELEF
jgi:Ser/Thr protein kinase RdoA (MazF antagonist)